MAINLATTYANTTPADANFPFGSSKNESSPGALDGTPLEKAIYDDIVGLMQSLLTATGDVPSNNPDNVRFPQYLTSIFNLRYYDRVDYEVGTKVVGSDGKTYVCQVANGVALANAQDPVIESPRVIWFTEEGVMFGLLHPVGSLFFSEDATNPGTTFGVGVWTQIEGKFIVGQDTSDTDFDVGGETGGSKTHTHPDDLSVDGHQLTVSEMPAHTHDTNVDHKFNTGAAATTQIVGETENADFSIEITSSSTGGDSSHTHELSGGVQSASNLPPYSVAYIWKRTA